MSKEDQPTTNEREPEMTPITISVVNGLYYTTREGYVDIQFTSFDDLVDFLADVLPEVGDESAADETDEAAH